MAHNTRQVTAVNFILFQKRRFKNLINAGELIRDVAERSRSREVRDRLLA